jgi:hypothetical protein
MSDIIRAVRTDIVFGDKTVDAYKLQNYHFEKRLGVTGVSEALGHSKEWFHRLPKQGRKQFEAMQNKGFTGCQILVRVGREEESGASIAKTISLRDFNKVVAYEAIKKRNINAIIFLVALSESGLERVISDAFDGVSLDWFCEKITHYSKWTYEELEEALEYNRDEVKSLYSMASILRL